MTNPNASNTNDPLQHRLDFALAAAKASSQITLKYFNQSNLDQSTKHDGTPVTIADRACESDLRDRIAAAYPEDSILGEEFPSKEGTSAYEWIIDPIDGTISFVQGVPLFGTMLACMKDNQPILGVITLPALNETVYAAQGLGCWHTSPFNNNDKNSHHEPIRAHASTTSQLDQALINTTSLSYFDTPQLRALYEQLDTQARHTRGWSDCYGFVLLATGRVDAIIEPVLSIWDFAAAIPIITESGAIWSDLAGNPNIASNQMLTANPTLHTQLIALMPKQP